MSKPEAHSHTFPPSKSSIWLNCELSTKFNDGTNEESTQQSIFGSEAHELGATLISKSLKLEDYEDEIKSVDEVISGFTQYSSEMQEIADGYADFVIKTYEYEKKRSDQDPLVLIEQQLDMDFDKDAFGTLDCGIISETNGGTLIVIDLKTGRLKVDAFDHENKRVNSQLALYSLALYKTYKDIYRIKNVRLVIYQPVISNIAEYEMSIDELLAFEKEVLIPAVNRAKTEVLEGRPGPHCKWCGGRMLCKARAKMNLEIAQKIEKPIETLTDDEIASILPKLDEFINFAEDLKAFSLKRALNGHKWQGLKLVKGKATRKITNEEAVIKVCEENGVDAYSQKKLAGITELTKRLGKKAFNELVGPYISMQESQPLLVLESDPREEMIIEKEEK